MLFTIKYTIKPLFVCNDFAFSASKSKRRKVSRQEEATLQNTILDSQRIQKEMDLLDLKSKVLQQQLQSMQALQSMADKVNLYYTIKMGAEFNINVQPES